MKNRMKMSAVALALLAWTGAGAAEPLSAEAAVARALAGNPRLLAAGAQARGAAAARAAAEGGRMPQLNAQYLARRSNNPLDAFADKLNRHAVDPATDFSASALNEPSASTLHATELALVWPLYTGGRQSASISEATENESAAQAGYRRARESTAWHTLATYHGAQAAQEAVHITDSAVRAAQEHADTTAQLLRERRIVVSDKLTAEVNLAMWRSAREQAGTRAVTSLNELRLAMGASLDEAIDLPAWSEITSGPAPDSLAHYERLALDRRADLRAQEAMVRAAKSRIDQARAGYKPRVDLIASESWYDDKPALDNESTRVMGVLSLNLWRGGTDRHQVAAAAENASLEEQQLEALRQQVAVEVRAAWQALAEARARVEICADNVGKAGETVRLVRGRYGEGRTILIDLLQAERTLTEARQEKLSATLAYVLAEARLRLATGTVLDAP